MPGVPRDCLEDPALTYGLVSVSDTPREAMLARCRVEGVDVTNRCYMANDAEGWAECYVRDEDGRFFVADGRIARERLRGEVVIDFPRGLD